MSGRKLENEKLCITIMDKGAEPCSIYDKEKKREVLWDADPTYWKRHAPVLFPNVGKHYGMKYLLNGKEYQSIPHGFARDKDFICIRQTENSVTHRLQADAETQKIFPFLFTFDVTHALTGNELEVQWKVTNESQEMMYFTIGGHPGFQVPILEGTKRSDYKLLFDRKEDLTFIEIDFPTGTAKPDHKHTLPLRDGIADITDDIFDQDALIFDGNQFDWVAIGYPDGTPYIGLRCKGFPNFGIWTLPDGPYICLEPWMGRCDDFGFEGEISQKPGVIALKSKELFQKEYQIIVY